MPAKRKAGRGSKKVARKPPVLENLTSAQADGVLKRLLSAHPELKPEAEEIARSLLSEVSFEQVAADVECSTTLLSTDELYDRAGAHSWGYVSPDEAAVQLLEEELEPFSEDMKRYAKLGMDAEELEVCKGVVLGLYTVRAEESDEFLQWAPEFPAEFARSVVEEWCAGGKGRAFPADFVQEHVPEWEFLTTIRARRPGGSR